MVVTDLFEDIKDGIVLIALLEVLSGQKLVRIYFSLKGTLFILHYFVLLISHAYIALLKYLSFHIVGCDLC